MARPLPPLNQLRAFEVAARHLSFSKAALELCVTPAAVSHHIRSLEEYLRCKLFIRLTRCLALTPDGEALLPVVRESFGSITEEVARLKAVAARQHLAVRMPPFLSARWLTPRLHSFVARYPGIELSLEHSTEPVDFHAGDVDIAVQWTTSPRTGVSVEPLITTRRIPMCSAALLQSRPRPRTPAEIRGFNLLHEFSYDDWKQWYEMQGLDPADTRRGYVFDNYEVLLRATIAGQGMSLLLESHRSTDFEHAELQKPFGNEGPEFSYCVMYPRGALRKPAVCAFHDWLFEQAKGLPVH